jgi:hypothetical protein
MTARCAAWTLLFLLIPAAVFAGFTQTLPKSTWLLEAIYMVSTIDSRWNNDGERVPLIDPIERYEPGAGSQGTLIPEAVAEMNVLAFQLQYGITDSWSFGFGMPIMLSTKIDPHFRWEEGDYQWNLGRQYSEQDFWEWAESMGQPKPEPWEGNNGVVGDFLIGSRFRFSDFWPTIDEHNMGLALQVTGAIPTGTQADPEEAVASGTTSWDLHANGDLGIRLGYDYFFPESLDDRLTLSTEIFYEFNFPHEYTSPTGEKNPLLLSFRPYVGKHYTIDGGDWQGYSVGTDIVPLKGPAIGTWLTKGSYEEAEKLPPLLTLTMRYTYIHMNQSDWKSDSEIWDWDREKLWRPGYKNILFGQAVISLLRLGVPMQPYVAHRNLTLIPGRNARAPNVWMVGSRFLLKFW